MLTSILLSLCLSAILIPPGSVTPTPEKITLPKDLPVEGIYWGKGMVGKTRYHIVVTITRVGEAFIFNWQIPNGPHAHGVGIRRGDLISVAYIQGKIVGVYQFTVSPGRLDGVFLSMAEGKVDRHVSREILTFLKRLPDLED
jgi:hypothetical protein